MTDDAVSAARKAIPRYLAEQAFGWTVDTLNALLVALIQAAEQRGRDEVYGQYTIATDAAVQNVLARAERAEARVAALRDAGQALLDDFGRQAEEDVNINRYHLPLGLFADLQAALDATQEAQP